MIENPDTEYIINLYISLYSLLLIKLIKRNRTDAHSTPILLGRNQNRIPIETPIINISYDFKRRPNLAYLSVKSKPAKVKGREYSSVRFPP